MRWRKSPFASHAREHEFDRELQFHIDELTRELQAQGIPPEEARRRARVEFGGKEQAAQQLREVHSIALWEAMRANVKSGVRLIRKAPTFSVAVIVTLALGIGANSAVFSAINAVLLRPLPFPHGDQLTLLRELNSKSADPPTFVAPVRLEEWNRLNSTFRAISGYYTQNDPETSGVLPEKVTQALVAPRFLQVWGVPPALGRDFTPEEQKFGGPNAVLISDTFWRRRFHGDRAAVGKTLHLGKTSYTIVGVMPASFLFADHDVELWSPVPADAPYAQDRQSTWYTAIGRLKPGVTLSQAQADLAAVQAQLGKQFPKTDADLSISVQSLKEDTISGVRRSLWMLFASVTVLLLIACTNIVALLLARVTDREHEITVRFSLGASRRALIAQLLSETFVLAIVGAALGLVLAGIAARVFRLLAADLPRMQEIVLDWRIVAYALLCSLAATFLCGLLPALRATRNLSEALAKDRRTHVSDRHPLQWSLVGVQVALAVTLLFGAGLLLRSFQQLSRVAPGFDPSHVLTLHISGSWGETVDQKALVQRIDRDLEAIRAVPGVAAAAISSSLPGVPGNNQTQVKLIEGQDPTRKVSTVGRFVSTGYFSVMRIPVLSGSACPPDGATRALLVNRSFAERYLPQTSALGRHLLLGEGSPFATVGEIRGVVADAREEGLTLDPLPTVYWCTSAPTPDPFFLVRTSAAPSTMAETLRRAIHQVEPARAVFNISPLEDHLSNANSESRLRTVLLGLFALTAISLVCVGLYGTLSYSVTLRRREIGLRLALGALPQQITLRYLWQALRVTAIGCGCGLLLAAAAGRLISGMLFGVSHLDALTFSTVIVLVSVVTSAAAMLPALRAARIDPMQTLRDE
jgi:putative ABC transport system permease protein